MLTTLASALLFPAIAGASTPGGATVDENTYTTDYTGVQQTRFDSIPGNFPTGSSCSTFDSSGSASFQQLEWIWQGTGANGLLNSINGGTQWQCATNGVLNEFYFLEVYNDGVLSVKGDSSTTSTSKRTFYLFQNDTGGNWTWHFQVGTNVLWSWISGWTGLHPENGLISTDDSIKSSYQLTQMNYTNSGPPPTGWAGFSNDGEAHSGTGCVDVGGAGETDTTLANLSENSTGPDCT